MSVANSWDHTAAEAIAYTKDVLPAPFRASVIMEVQEQRYDQTPLRLLAKPSSPWPDRLTRGAALIAGLRRDRRNPEKPWGVPTNRGGGDRDWTSPLRRRRFGKGRLRFVRLTLAGRSTNAADRVIHDASVGEAIDAGFPGVPAEYPEEQ